jgi:hypothetical protein
MGNLKNFNFNKIDAYLSNSEYYDFYLGKDEDINCCMYDGTIVSGDCFVVHYDFNESGIYASGTTSADTIYSLVTWTGATNTGYTLNTFGLTGVDNGYVTFEKTATEQYEYPIEIISGNTTIGDYSRLCGGFYQGYFKLLNFG